MFDKSDIEAVVEQTLQRVGQRRSIVTRPETARDWAYVITAICFAIGFLWTAIVYLNRVAEHHKLPMHEGTLKEIKDLHIKHEEHHRSDYLHIRESELKLRIMQETEPIKEKVNLIQSDVSTIKTKLDILIDREQR